jgi:hypothetical protein
LCKFLLSELFPKILDSVYGLVVIPKIRKPIGPVLHLELDGQVRATINSLLELMMTNKAEGADLVITKSKSPSRANQRKREVSPVTEPRERSKQARTTS